MLNYLLFAMLFLNSCIAHEINIKTSPVDGKTTQVKVTFNLDKDEYLYKESINFSVDSPHIHLSEWHSTAETINKYDEGTKNTKAVFNTMVDILLYAGKQIKQIEQDIFLYITYQTNKQTHPHQKLFQLFKPIYTEKNTKSIVQKDNIHSVNNPDTPSLKKVQKSDIQTIKKSTSWSEFLSHLVKHTQSLPMRLILVFLLGILLSLTPCIYPMIPITASVLHAQKSNSLIYNFLLSLAYTLGLSATFACFGLVASYTGPIYGKLLVHPISVGILVSFLMYLALSMFGFYDLYIPRFMQPAHTGNSGGSLISSFIFGAASGTIASPCVSPGLILLLSIVATLGNVFLGFLLLFCFGIGLSMPLLIVGTFSSSLTLLPKAGLWMVEIKKLFGLMLFGVSLYYLSNILPLSTVLFVGASTLIIIGFYYLYIGNYKSASSLKTFHIIWGFILLSSATSLVIYTTQLTYYVAEKPMLHWHTDYENAREQSLKENKLLLIDFWADYCSICKAINNTVFKDPSVIAVIEQTIPVSIDGSNEKEEPFNTLKQQFKVFGFPTILLVEPESQKILKQWNSELYSMDRNVFIDELKEFIAD